jgi:hypothetical protein
MGCCFSKKPAGDDQANADGRDGGMADAGRSNTEVTNGGGQSADADGPPAPPPEES